MDFEWDEEKRLTNLAKHRLDFVNADILFEGPYLEATARTEKDEARYMAIGRIEPLIVTAIFAWRQNKIRLISLRRARDEEKRIYENSFGR